MRDAGCKKLYPINPKREEVLGIKCYPSISAVPEKLDLAILLTPPDAVLGLVKECVENKVGGAVVFASGFGELGPEGKELEKEIGRIGREGGTRIIGPNCLGFFNPRNGVVTYPQVLMKGVPTEMGTVGGVSQSGSFVDYLVWFLSTKGVRFSQRGQLRQRVRPGRRGLPGVPGPGRQDQDHRLVHGRRQGRPALLRGGPRGLQEEAHHPVEGRHERAGRQGRRLAHRSAWPGRPPSGRPCSSRPASST